MPSFFCAPHGCDEAAANGRRRRSPLRPLSVFFFGGTVTYPDMNSAPVSPVNAPINLFQGINPRRDLSVFVPNHPLAIHPLNRIPQQSNKTFRLLLRVAA